MVARGEIWLARLDPTEGREIRKTRPCLVVSPPEVHDHLDIVIVVPVTTRSHPARYRVETRLRSKSGRFLLEQIRAVDKSRLLRRLGEVGPKNLSLTLDTLRAMFVE